MLRGEHVVAVVVVVLVVLWGLPAWAKAGSRVLARTRMRMQARILESMVLEV